MIYVNRRRFQEAGIDASDAALTRWTWQDLTTNHQKLVRREGGKVTRSGILFGVGTSLEDFTTFLYANGGQFYNKDRTGVAFNNAMGQQALEAFVDFRHKFKMHEAPEGLNALTGFPQGAMAAVVFGSWNQRDFLGNPLSQNLDYTMMNIPRGPTGKQQSTTAWTNMTVMPKSSKNKDAAWAFIEHFHSLPVAVQPLLREVVIDQKRSVRDALAEAERQANLVMSQVK